MPEPFTAAAARLSGVEQAILTEAADRFDVIAKDSASRVVGGGATMRLHGRGGRRVPVKLGTKSNISGESLFVNGTPLAQWVWIEEGTKPHSVGRGRRGAPSFLKAPSYGHPIRGPIEHHGSTGARAWTRAVDEFRSEYPDIVIDKVRKALS
jgi:hypothetical protein